MLQSGCLKFILVSFKVNRFFKGEPKTPLSLTKVQKIDDNMKSHALAHYLLKMSDMEVKIPQPNDMGIELIQDLESYSIAKSGVVGDSQHPYKESIILYGDKQKDKGSKFEKDVIM
jgi:hypothetical protein